MQIRVAFERTNFPDCVFRGTDVEPTNDARKEENPIFNGDEGWIFDALFILQSRVNKQTV